MTSTRLQIAFITGRSNPACWHLSGTQQGFLSRLAAPGRRLVPFNFPYVECLGSRVHVPLWLASFRNSLEYLGSRRPAFVDSYRPAVIELLSQAPHTLFLAGSCGLELLNNLTLPSEWHDRVSVFAYGPVAKDLPPFRSWLVQGRSDLLSRYWIRHVDQLVGAGHLDYLESADVLSRCQAFVECIEGQLEILP